MKRFRVLLLLILHSTPVFQLQAQGEVLLVLGSDTAIWDGMDVDRYNCTYLLSLYTDPGRNAHLVMDPAFRAPLRDSYGRPVVLTWWMMAGNIFRYATNTDIPHPNTMTLHLMKKYHGEAIRSFGDELTLHYHTFVWSDYNRDGTWYWNQGKTFAESYDDFDVTLAEMVLEEETFPVSFRSGWHAMDNDWQRRIDQILPYSMHNAWPAKRVDTTEPLDNIYDWSRSPQTRIPFHPSLDDYQVPGNARGWNLRSTYMSSADSAFMAGIFAQAAGGADQVVCLWAHLPESDFLQNVRKIDSSAHKAAIRYPAVKFRYCTAVEAMKRWRKATDKLRPVATLTETGSGDPVVWRVEVNEPIFQTVPFVAMKDRYEQYTILTATPVGGNAWQATSPLPRADLAKIGVAVTDTSGNLGTAILRYLPEDLYVDNADPGFSPLTGAWGVTATTSWGTTSHVATIPPGESGSVRWSISGIAGSPLCNIFAQVPAIPPSGSRTVYRFLENGMPVDSVEASGKLIPHAWNHLFTRRVDPSRAPVITMTTTAGGTASASVYADVIKCSPLVRDRWVKTPSAIDGGEVIAGEVQRVTLRVDNLGIQNATIPSVTSISGAMTGASVFPATIPPMSHRELEMVWTPPDTGVVVDTIVIISDDPLRPVQSLPYRAHARHYFRLVDDRDSLFYREQGTWAFSTAGGYLSTSRYAYPATGVSATFAAEVARAGLYDIESIVPKTVNASDRARYFLAAGGTPLDSVFINQNTGSGVWVLLMSRQLPANTPLTLTITDAMNPVIGGRVLRADAIRFQWRPGTTGTEGNSGATVSLRTALDQNSPNPFNPSTLLRFRVARPGRIELTVHDLLGREVARLFDEVAEAGEHEVRFDASGLASGVYLAFLRGDGFRHAVKMTLIR